MVTIEKVRSKAQKKQFVLFPHQLYKECPQYVPALQSSEMELFSPKKNVSFDECEIEFFLAMKDNKVCGRICGVIQKQYNEKTQTKHARFTRFDCVNDKEVSNALFAAFESWAKEKGMDEFHGPLGFNDLDFEGMLCEGFEYMANFEEPYSYEYYLNLMKEAGYEKEIDWIENRLFMPKEVDPKIIKIAAIIEKRYNLHVIKEKSKSKFLKKYASGIFHVIDEAYKDLHGVIPFTEKLRKQIISQFKLLISMKYMIAIANESDDVVAFGFALPAINKAVKKSKGKLLPFGLFRILAATKNPKVCDLGIVGILPEYKNKGVVSLILKYIMESMIKENIEYCETNICLENNINILNQWEYFDHVQHRRRRCFKKSLKKSKE